MSTPVKDSFEFDQESEIEAVSSYFHNIHNTFEKASDSAVSVNGYHFEQLFPQKKMLLKIQSEGDGSYIKIVY